MVHIDALPILPNLEITEFLHLVASSVASTSTMQASRVLCSMVGTWCSHFKAATWVDTFGCTITACGVLVNNTGVHLLLQKTVLVQSQRLRCRRWIRSECWLSVLAELSIDQLAIGCVVILVHELVLIVFLKHLIQQVWIVEIDEVIGLESRVHRWWASSSGPWHINLVLLIGPCLHLAGLAWADLRSAVATRHGLCADLLALGIGCLWLSGARSSVVGAVIDYVDLVPNNNARVCIWIMWHGTVTWLLTTQIRGVWRLKRLVLDQLISLSLACFPWLWCDRRGPNVRMVLQWERVLWKWVQLAWTYMLNSVVRWASFLECWCVSVVGLLHPCEGAFIDWFDELVFDGQVAFRVLMEHFVACKQVFLRTLLG